MKSKSIQYKEFSGAGMCFGDGWYLGQMLLGSWWTELLSPNTAVIGIPVTTA